MKTKIQKLIFLFICLFGIQEAFGQPNASDCADGLKVSAEAFYSTSRDVPKLNVMIFLLDTTNHDITVLTRDKSSRYFNLSSDKTKFRFWFWFDSGLKWNGHPVAPSLPELAPVTIKPNEAALCHMAIDQNGESKTLLGLTKDSPIVISYEISPSLGNRFGCWSGRIDTKPINASFATIPIHTP